ncbi:RNA ligase family protein [Haladaptatus sp. NG-SE-30]
MQDFPSVPSVDDAPPELFEGGHLWIQEDIDGASLRFQLQGSGLLRFGDEERVFDPESIPAPYQHVVRHVRENLDREAVRTATDDVESVVFFGVATRHQTIDYDWNRIPSFLGFDVWTGDKERFLPPDAVERIYTRLGLDPVNTFEKEARAVDFDPESYEMPRSAWYDGTPKGVVIRNKTGQRAKLPVPRFEDDAPRFEADPDSVPTDTPAAELAARYATNRRIASVVESVKKSGRPVSVESVYERVLEDIYREEYATLFHDRTSVDMQEFRSEVAAQTRRFVDE